ncbi:hypothetical protein OG607_32720 [Streptomyces sp. NBC_01537]|jgi:hypothetical protein|uniref:hypothetical protein n=1 Tax=unclassified Streptomyces TaxID=2593676 RepID=UPI002E3392B9|nr:hypothetical protein [Streptomyces sp. NBC_01262]
MSRYGGKPAASVIAILADAAAFILALWIFLHVFDANTGNSAVDFVHRTANWLSSWAHDLFRAHADWLRTLLNYGLPAVIYLFVGHALANRFNKA